MPAEVNFERIEKAIRYLSRNFRTQPSLEEMAERAHLSPYHFQRIFTEWAGVSPKKFLQYLTVETLKKELLNAPNLIEAADAVGLSSQSRVYDLFVTVEAVTPQEYRSKGFRVEIDYGFHQTPFGECCLGITERGICFLGFVTGSRSKTKEALQRKWENATLRLRPESTREIAQKIFRAPSKPEQLKLFLKGTPFQLKVWEALLRIPFGQVSSYQRIAESIGRPEAARAVGSAIGENFVAFLIPCHRVIKSEGIVGDYHWGGARKSAIIGWEKAARDLPGREHGILKQETVTRALTTAEV